MNDARPEKPETAAEAIYPGKEAWKNEPGNRYTAEELRQMQKNWHVELRDGNVPESRWV
jgi:hypothetical protein